MGIFNLFPDINALAKLLECLSNCKVTLAQLHMHRHGIHPLFNERDAERQHESKQSREQNLETHYYSLMINDWMLAIYAN